MNDIIPFRHVEYIISCYCHHYDMDILSPLLKKINYITQENQIIEFMEGITYEDMEQLRQFWLCDGFDKLFPGSKDILEKFVFWFYSCAFSGLRPSEISTEENTGEV